jgi:hypothetical protein
MMQKFVRPRFSAFLNAFNKLFDFNESMDTASEVLNKSLPIASLTEGFIPNPESLFFTFLNKDLSINLQNTKG